MSLWVVQGVYNINGVGCLDDSSDVDRVWGLCILRTAFRVWSASIAYSLSELQRVWYVYNELVPRVSELYRVFGVARVPRMSAMCLECLDRL